MNEKADDPTPEAGKLPTGRLARTARVGGLVTGQGLRWAGMRTANRVRTPERAAAAQSERTAALVEQLVEQLGQMRGAAMKVGQMLSMVEFDGLGERRAGRAAAQARGAARRRPAGAVRAAREADAARSSAARSDAYSPISTSVHSPRRRSVRSIAPTTVDGEDVVVKVQYPGVAEAVETDLRNAMMLLPLVKRLAPGLDAKGLAVELRERISEELDYELEAQNQRRIERLMRGHPFMRVPRVYTDLSTRRVLVSEYVEGERFETVRRTDEPQRDRYGEIVFRFYFGLLYRDLIALGDPHPGNYLLCPDGRVCFLDFGLVRDIDAGRVAAERAIALAARERDAAGSEGGTGGGRVSPGRWGGHRRPDWAMRMIRMVIKWYAVPRERRFSPDNERRGRDRERPDEEQRAEARTQVSQFTLPPELILIRRMHRIVAVVLMQLRAGADWGAIAAEYLHGEPPATPLGEAEAEFFTRRGRRGAVDLEAAG